MGIFANSAMDGGGGQYGGRAGGKTYSTETCGPDMWRIGIPERFQYPMAPAGMENAPEPLTIGEVASTLEKTGEICNGEECARNLTVGNPTPPGWGGASPFDERDWVTAVG